MSLLSNFTLPTPRRTALKRDSIQERNLISHIERSLHNISTKIEHTSSGISSLIPAEESDERVALARREGQYPSLSSLLSDFNSILDILHVSATPWVQIPLLLTFIDALSGYVPLFGFREAEMGSLLSLLGKLDAVSESALRPKEGRSWEWAWSVTTTQLVRLEGLSQGLRVAVVRYVNSQGPIREGERLERKGLDAFNEDDDGKDEGLGTTEDEEDDEDGMDGDAVLNIRLDRPQESSNPGMGMDVDGGESEFDGAFQVEDDDDEPDWMVDIGRVMEKTITACNSLLEERGGVAGRGASGSIADPTVPP